jgi:hypothetical protein
MDQCAPNATPVLTSKFGHPDQGYKAAEELKESYGTIIDRVRSYTYAIYMHAIYHLNPSLEAFCEVVQAHVYFCVSYLKHR